MLRSSQFLKLIRLNLRQHADSGIAVPVETIPIICDLMSHIERECQKMEIRLAGEIVPLELMRPADTKVVSLAAFAQRRSAKHSSKPIEPA